MHPAFFLQFQAHVERLLDTKIKCVHYDWGGEYQRIHNTFFRSLGIAHRVSCPHTHQQNGSAERKHRHIVETGLALLAHAHMPIKFWDEAFLTATYLINRLPTRVIDHKCPLERLLKTPPNYSLLRIFGCACWPHLRPYNTHKLSFRSKQCVFLGYSSSHKGYKCLDTDSGRIYISRDVIFDENIFPFAQISSIPTSCNSSNLRQLHLDSGSSFLEGDHMHISWPANSLVAANSVPPAAPVPVASTSGFEPTPNAAAPVLSGSPAAPLLPMPVLGMPETSLIQDETHLPTEQSLPSTEFCSEAHALSDDHNTEQ